MKSFITVIMVCVLALTIVGCQTQPGDTTSATDTAPATDTVAATDTADATESTVDVTDTIQDEVTTEAPAEDSGATAETSAE